MGFHFFKNFFGRSAFYFVHWQYTLYSYYFFNIKKFIGSNCDQFVDIFLWCNATRIVVTYINQKCSKKDWAWQTASYACRNQGLWHRRPAPWPVNVTSFVRTPKFAHQDGELWFTSNLFWPTLCQLTKAMLLSWRLSMGNWWECTSRVPQYCTI